MARLLLLVAIVVVVALLVRRLVKALRDPSTTEPPVEKPIETTEAKLVR